MLTIALTVAATAAAYRAGLAYLNKAKPGSLANKAAVILGGGGPGEEEKPK